MADENDQRYKHFILEGFSETEEYRSPQQGGERGSVPDRDRQRHGRALFGQIQGLKIEAASARKAQEQAGMKEGLGLQVEFESFPDIELAFESLARDRSGIELLNVRQEKKLTFATIFVPDGKLEHFERLISAYLERKVDKRGYPRDNKRLLNAIREIRAASLRALWTDDPEVIPDSDEESIWWEVWLPVRRNRKAVVAGFRQRAEMLGLLVPPGEVSFPERTVLLAHASSDQMKRSIATLNSIAELRRAKETAEFFDALRPGEQAEWLNELLDRTRIPQSEDSVPYVCLLDTGANNGHPLLAPALADPDLHSVEPGWGTDDSHGHGTQMAGLALGGNLVELLDDSGPAEIGHRLESVKLLQEEGADGGDPQHYGYLTTEAVARPEITAPSRQRVFGMAVTAQDDRDRGRPSSWSSAVDRLASDADGQGANPRLLVISAGNVRDSNDWIHYPDSNETDGVHDPAQAWNALTVGACTDLARITEADGTGYQPIAPAGGLSPFSTTSLTWEKDWPLKPDVLLEGGNAARDALSAVWMPSLSLLTTHHRPADRVFTTANATSAATALAARMAAQVMAVYSELWPETVRGLIVHSAEWTDVMKGMFLPTRGRGRPNKNDYRRLIQRCGFGVPSLERALWSVSNSLTMVVQEQLHPFKREEGKPSLRDMQLHSLPWPQEVLEELVKRPSKCG